MKLAILFWFYKESEVCQNRLEILRRHNPTTPIYGLYGGDLARVDHYKSVLSPYLDDFYVFSEAKDAYWKWVQGDLMITQWFRDRGHELEWDTIIIVQWDMLVFGPVEQLFATLQPEQILLSGLRPIAEVEAEWQWTSPRVRDRREQYLEFCQHIRKTYDYQQDPLGCLFIVIALPRNFLKQYAQVPEPELGFLEYRIPMYAQILGTPFCTEHPYRAWWVDADPLFWAKNPLRRVINSVVLKFNPNPLNPAKREISLIAIGRHLLTHNGARIFHPYEQLFPSNQWQWLRAVATEFKRDLDWLTQKLLRRG
ncbi:MAG: hypothetical protein NW220_10680 [Leptolyngbyaceae cyanobacterium bins.349]|nr:hypothetical protein [Leptolyngbyaceae cyanobacterium bins.349]